MEISDRFSRFRTVDGTPVPRLGLGTWRMGEDPDRRGIEGDALRLGLDLGLNLLDTAEMYANAEQVVGDAIAERREQAFVVSKVLPENASSTGVIEAAERSLRALRTEVIDLYLLHWESRYPLEETFDAFRRLHETGKIRHFGVSNFDVAEMETLWRTRGGKAVAANQILYNLSRRSPEWELMDRCHSRDVTVMSYSPLEQERILTNATLRKLAKRHHTTAATVALAWVLRRRDVVTIPKASDPEHVRENAKALDLQLTEADEKELDREFPPPSGPTPLGLL